MVVISPLDWMLLLKRGDMSTVFMSLLQMDVIFWQLKDLPGGTAADYEYHVTESLTILQMCIANFII